MLWILLIVYQIKHFVADYPLQGKYMLGKFKPYPDFILPLLAHVGVHAGFTFLIAIALKPLKVAIVLALLDAAIHFVVDRIKASPNLLGRFHALSKNDMKNILSYSTTLSPEEFQQKFGAQLKSNVFFWWSLGWDQMMHHLTHYLIIWALLP